MENLSEDEMMLNIRSHPLTNDTMSSMVHDEADSDEDGEAIDMMVEVTEEDPMIGGHPSSRVTMNSSFQSKTETDLDASQDIHNELNTTQQLTSSSKSMPSIPFGFPGQTFDIKCQKLILNVWDFFKRLKRNPDLLFEIKSPQERAAAALHISPATIGKIAKNLKKTGKLETPGKKRNRTKPVVGSVSEHDELVIRQIIEELKSKK